MEYDLVVRNGRVLGSNDDLVADVAVRGEAIAAVGHDLHGAREIDAAGCYVIPGAIDAHVHMRTNRREYVYDDTFETGSIAGAFGGVTTMIDQVQPEPGTSLADALDSRLDEARGHTVIDYAFHMNVREASAERLAEIPRIAARGVPSFKFFMTYDTYRVPDEFIFAAMLEVAALDGMAIVHAENDAVINELLRRNEAAGRTSLRDRAAARPAVMEGEAVHRALAMAEVAGAAVLIFHLTARQSVRELAAARDRGQTAFGEACLQHLLLGPEAYDVPVMAVSPPLREREHRDALWRGLADGVLDIVSTDHAPRRWPRDPDGTVVPQPGTAGIEVRLALIHTLGVRAGRLTLNEWVDRCCSRQAELFNLERKGRIAPGYDADIVIFDPERTVDLTPEVLHSNIDHTTYEGFTARGFPVTTISRGQEIVRDGDLVGRPGHGRFLERGGRPPAEYRNRRRAVSG